MMILLRCLLIFTHIYSYLLKIIDDYYYYDIFLHYKDPDPDLEEIEDLDRDRKKTDLQH